MHALFVCYLFRSNKLYVLRLLYLAQLIKASNLINSVLRMEQDVESLSFMGTHTDCMRNIYLFIFVPCSYLSFL